MLRRDDVAGLEVDVIMKLYSGDHDWLIHESSSEITVFDLADLYPHSFATWPRIVGRRKNQFHAFSDLDFVDNRL